MNLPLQQRAGKNPSSRPYFYPVAVTGRSVIFRLSATQDNVLVSGSEEEGRVTPLHGGEGVAKMYNFAGVSVDIEAYFVDEQNNEYLLKSASVGDAGTTEIDFGEGSMGLLPDEKIILRVTDGDPNAGDGCHVIVGFQTVSEDLVNVRKDISDTSLVDLFSPSPGELWVPIGLEEFESLLLCNGDDIDHTFDVYLNDGLQDFLMHKATLIQAGKVGDIGVFDTAAAAFPAGYTPKVKMLQPRNTPGSRILFAGSMARAALSKDDSR